MGLECPLPVEMGFESPLLGGCVKSLGLKASSLAVYCNGVISVSGYAITIVEDPDACPASELINLRRQAEALAKQERLFEVKSKNWLSWEDAQKARVSAVKLYVAATERGKKQTLLRECMVLAFMTLQPPDRVGVVRRLRLGEGGSLYKRRRMLSIQLICRL